MHIDDILTSMRDGEVQSDERITTFIQGVVDGSVSRPQAAAWLAWAYSRTLTNPETTALTRAMTHTGDVLSWGDGPPLIDKHSTGGVGDKVSLILAPLWAELGYRVPMISGRGLSHTGGTLDKLEAIPGYTTNNDEPALRKQLGEVGAFITAQTGDLAPADRVLYALRNEICTVPSVPLITGSILSKKLASGVHRLVLDVKCGSGAFMTDVPSARALARSLVDVARAAGLECQALITAMDRPLGRAIGNAVEVEESIEVLKGGGPSDLVDLVVELAVDDRARDVLASGAAYARFERMVSAQGGRLDGELHGGGTREHVVLAERSGVISQLDALSVGRAAFLLGAGRVHADDPVDFGVGIWLEAQLGDAVQAGQPLARILHRDKALDEAVSWLRKGIVVDDVVATHHPPVIARLD